MDPPQSQNPLTTNTCLSCTTAFESIQDGDIICPEGHFFCALNKCSQIYIDLIFSEPHIYYPGKCPMCKSIFPQEQLIKLMDENRKQVFSELDTRFGAESEKATVKTVDTLVEEINELSGEEKHAEIKQIVEEMIERHSQVFCPGCQTGGRKDLECTHILCPTCSIKYCYICGQEESVLNKADEYGDIFSHNEEWICKEERCPMYFREIFGVDTRYPEEESEAMNLFHQLKIKKALQELFLGINEEEIRDMEQQFKILERYEIKIDELLDKEMNIVMIQKELS